MVVYEHDGYLIVESDDELPPVIEYALRFWRYLCPCPDGGKVYIAD